MDEHFVIPKTQDSKTESFEAQGPSLVGDPLGWLVVTAPVHLDDEPSRLAVEIHDEGADRMLTTELVALETPVTQMVPEALLGVGLPLSKLSRSKDGSM